MIDKLLEAGHTLARVTFVEVVLLALLDFEPIQQLSFSAGHYLEPRLGPVHLNVAESVILKYSPGRTCDWRIIVKSGFDIGRASLQQLSQGCSLLLLVGHLLQYFPLFLVTLHETNSAALGCAAKIFEAGPPGDQEASNSDGK